MTLELEVRKRLEKHRLEKEAYSIDFADRLAAGDELEGVPEVHVLQEAEGADVDVSDEFGIAGETIDGTAVKFTLDEATEGGQDGGDYVLRVACETANGLRPVSVHRLTVSELGDDTAP